MKKCILSLSMLSLIFCINHQVHSGMAEVLLTELRDAQSDMVTFRRASDALTRLLAARVAEKVTTAAVAVETQLGIAQGAELIDDIILVPIMRSGNVMLQSFLQVFKDARVGFVLLQRDEETALPTFYYDKIPTVSSRTQAIILEPMLATGGSLNMAISVLKNKGIPNERITIVNVICATEGLERVQKEFPGITVIYAAQDTELNDTKFIVPGLGDYGDRYYGTEN